MTLPPSRSDHGKQCHWLCGPRRNEYRMSKARPRKTRCVDFTAGLAGCCVDYHAWPDVTFHSQASRPPPNDRLYLDQHLIFPSVHAILLHAVRSPLQEFPPSLPAWPSFSFLKTWVYPNWLPGSIGQSLVSVTLYHNHPHVVATPAGLSCYLELKDRIHRKWWHRANRLQISRWLVLSLLWRISPTSG